ncbi:hypothetical protein ABZP36_003230 [Zizania latifolia]
MLSPFCLCDELFSNLSTHSVGAPFSALCCEVEGTKYCSMKKSGCYLRDSLTSLFMTRLQQSNLFGFSTAESIGLASGKTVSSKFKELELARPAMRKEIIIRMHPDSDRYHNKALMVAAAISGVESVTGTGRDRDLLLVIGDGVDESKLTKKLRKEVGEAEIVELRTLDAAGGAAEALVLTAGNGKGDIVFAQSPYHEHPTPGRSAAGGGGATEMPVLTAGSGNGTAVFAQSPYHLHPTPGRSMPGGDSRVTYPVTPGAASPVAARWLGEHRSPLYYPIGDARQPVRGQQLRPRRGAQPPGELLTDVGAAQLRRRWPRAPENREASSRWTGQLLLDLVTLFSLSFFTTAWWRWQIRALSNESL